MSRINRPRSSIRNSITRYIMMKTLDVPISYKAVPTGSGVLSYKPRMPNTMVKNEPTNSMTPNSFHHHAHGNRHQTCQAI